MPGGDSGRLTLPYATKVSKPEQAPFEVTGPGKVNYLSHIDKVIEVSATKHSARYGKFLGSWTGLNVKETLVDALNPAVIAAFRRTPTAWKARSVSVVLPRHSELQAYGSFVSILLGSRSL